MNDRPQHVVFGAGDVGQALAAHLSGLGYPVRVVTRNQPPVLPAGVEWRGADASDADAATESATGAAAIYQCLNAPYSKWATLFPPLQRGVVAAAERNGALLVSLENLYGYGPTGGAPMTEDLPLLAATVKGRTRAAMTQELLDARDARRLHIAIGRASDFFGAGVTDGSTLGERVFGNALAGRRADFIGNPELFHTYSYVPDIARGLATLGTDERAIDQVWHLPGPETVNTQRVLELIADQVGHPLDSRSVPKLAMRALGLFNPVLRSTIEMTYQFDQPFVLDTTKYRDDIRSNRYRTPRGHSHHRRLVPGSPPCLPQRCNHQRLRGPVLIARQRTTRDQPKGTQTMNPATTTPDPATRFLTRPEGRIGYDIAGTGPLVILVPGMGDLRSAYRFIAPTLSQSGFRVACTDLRGHGDSDPTFPSYGDPETAGDITALVEELGGPAVIVGNSMAAGAATLVAAERPDLVAGLVLIGPFVRNGKTSAVQRILLRAAMARPWAPASWKAYMPKLYAGRRPDDFNEHRTAVVASLRRHGYTKAFSLTTRTDHGPAEARLADVSAPTMVIMGERDPDFPDPTAEAAWIGQTLRAEVVMVPEAGHYPQSQQPELTTESILRFLNGIDLSVVANEIVR